MQFKNILVPIDFSDFSKKALNEAVKLAQCCRGKIHLIHVEEDVFDMRRIHEMHPPVEKLCEQVHRGYLSQKKKYLEKFKKFVPSSVLEKAVIREGHPFVEIVKYARGQRIDLVVMSSHGQSNIKHALLGSTTDRVARKAPCAVLIVKDKRRRFVSL